MLLRNLAAAALAVVVFQACSVAMKVPVSRFDTPEVVGQIGKFRVSAGGGTSIETVFTPDYGYYAPDFNQPNVHGQPTLFFNGQAGVMPWLDVQLKSPFNLQTKAQFLGDSEMNAGKGNFSGAWTLSYGYENDNSSNQEFLGSGSASYELNRYNWDTALVFGYRFMEAVMVYGGPYVRWISFDGSDKTYTAPIASRFDGKSRLLGFNTGVRVARLGQPTFIGASVYLEGGWYQYRVGGLTHNGGSIGAAVEFSL